MKRAIIRTVAFVGALGLVLSVGCHDATKSAENQALTAKRQETIRQHKQSDN
jgi:hypothetical protein